MAKVPPTNTFRNFLNNLVQTTTKKYLWKKGSLNLGTREIVVFLQVSDNVSVVGIPREFYYA
jgi:flagellar biogenesis protein FliO